MKVFTENKNIYPKLTLGLLMQIINLSGIYIVFSFLQKTNHSLTETVLITLSLLLLAKANFLVSKIFKVSMV